MNLVSVVIVSVLSFLGLITTEPLAWRLIKVWLLISIIFVGMLVTSMFRYQFPWLARPGCSLLKNLDRRSTISTASEPGCSAPSCPPSRNHVLQSHHERVKTVIPRAFARERDILAENIGSRGGVCRLVAEGGVVVAVVLEPRGELQRHDQAFEEKLVGKGHGRAGAGPGSNRNGRSTRTGDGC